MNNDQVTQEFIADCLYNLTFGLHNCTDLNLEREILLELVNELTRLLVLEA